MRVTLLLLLAATACGRILFDEHPPSAPPDATSPDAPRKDAGSPDAPHLCRVTEAAQPMWVKQGPFLPTSNPTGAPGIVWVATISGPPDASFAIPFRAGDRIVGLSFDGFGNSGAVNLTGLKVFYQPDEKSNWQELAAGDDNGRQSMWGKVTFSSFVPTDLAEGSKVWVQFSVTGGVGYYLGQVTPVIERPCGM